MRQFNPVTLKRVWIRDHRKVLVVDGRVAIMGGVNMSSSYLGSGSAPGADSVAHGAGKDPAAPPGTHEYWRDTDIQITGHRLVYRAHDVDGKVRDEFVIEK